MPMNTSSRNHDWKRCASWLNNCGCLPPNLKQRLLNDELTFAEFANSLKDGEMLCYLLHYLHPGSIDLTQVNRRAQLSSVLCLNNINLFLDACKSPVFNLNESDLFDAHMLYDLDLPRVIRALSILSRSTASRERGGDGFKLLSDLSPSDENDVNDSNDDIYYNIPPLNSNDEKSNEDRNEDREQPEMLYTDESFIIGSQNANTSGSSSNDNHDGAYQIIVHDSSSTNATDLSAKRSNQPPQRRDFVMREIVNTEENFINGVNTLNEDFLRPLSEILNEVDRKCICININALIQLHTTLYNHLLQACRGGQGRTVRICNVFDSFKLDMMREYGEYFSSIDRSLARCDSLTNSPIGTKQNSANSGLHNYNAQFRAKLDECRSRSKRGNFKLTDLLRLPYQRILKYHLLFGELLKQTDKNHPAYKAIEKTHESMSEVGNYLNECQRDKENLNQIEKIMSHLSADFKMPSSTTLKDYGRFIKDDNARVKSIDSGERLARTRTLFLFEKALFICKSKGDTYSYKETLLVNEFNLDESGTNTSNNSIAAALVNVFDSGSSSTSSINHANNNINSGSSSNIHSNSNAYNFVLHNADRTRIYGFYFKTPDQKTSWKQCFINAKKKLQPEGQCDRNHKFLLHNFDKEMAVCHVCKSHLHGIFFQGYRCEFCLSIAHKACLTKTTQCPASKFNGNTLNKEKSISTIGSSFRAANSQQQQQPQQQNDQQLQANMNRCQPYFVRAQYSYDGRPQPPEPPVLIFKEGDVIQVIDDDDDEWWKGILFKPKNQQSSNLANKDEVGYFPRRYVNTKPSNNNLDDYSWFAPVDRNMADLILNRIENPTNKTIFMVRCRQEGGYAISIKYNGLVEHIKININYLDASPTSLLNQHSSISSLNSLTANSRTNSFLSTGANGTVPYYSIDQRHFSSVVSLISFYSQNTLKENFPQLETTLGLPYKEALPLPNSYAIAKYDYVPTQGNREEQKVIDLVKGQKYFILSKEANWWKVFNVDGLIGYAPSNFLQEIRID